MVTAAATRIATRRVDLRPLLDGRALPSADRARPAHDSRPLRSTRPAHGRGWSTHDDDDDAEGWRPKYRRIPFIGPIAVLVVIASIVVGWQRFFHPAVPAPLKAWVDHGAGVDFAPSDASFRVRLPSSPTVETVRVTVAAGIEGIAHVATSFAGDFEVDVVWFAVPDGTLDVAGSDPLTTAGGLAGRAGGFRVVVPEATHHAKWPALDAEIEHRGHDGDALVVVRGSEIYAVVISGPHDVTTAYAHLRRVFEVH